MNSFIDRLHFLGLNENMTSGLRSAVVIVSQADFLNRASFQDTVVR